MKKRNIIVILFLIIILFFGCDGYKGLHRENYGRSQQIKTSQHNEIQQHYIK